MLQRTQKFTRISAAAIALAVGFGVFAQSFGAFAANTIPKQLNYQARITNAAGVPLGDGSLSVKFQIWDDPSAGTCQYTARGSCGTPTAKTVTITNGTFTTQIGGSGDNAIPDTLFDNSTLYLGITVGADAEMTPRKQITAAAYAFNADRLDAMDTSNSGGATAFVPVTDSSGNLTLTGNVGLGSTASTSTKLSIRDALASPTNNIFQISNSNDSTRYLTVSSTSTYLAGNVGIGTTTPQYGTLTIGNYSATLAAPLAVQVNGAGIGFSIANSATEYTDFASGGVLKGMRGHGTVQFTVSNDGDIYFSPQNSEVMRLTNGNVGIGDTTPASLLTVGSGDKFQVDTNGNIVKINNVTTSFPSSQGGSNTFLRNNGSGTLTWVAASGLGTTLQNVYDASTSPELTLDATRGALTVRDAVSGVGNLLEIQDNNNSLSYLTVSSTSTYLAGNVGIGTASPVSLLEIGTNAAASNTRLKVVGYSDTFPLQEWGDGSGNVWSRIGRTSGNIMYMDTANYGGADAEIRGNYKFTGNLTLGDASGDTVTSNSAVWSFPASTTVALNNAGNALNFDSNTLSIDALSNYVGIGTASPQTKLHAEDAASGANVNVLTVSNVGTGVGTAASIQFRLGGSSYGYVRSIAVPDGVTNRLDLAADGGGPHLSIFGSKVGIGTTAPTGKLTVADASSAAGNLLQITNSNDSLRYLTVSSTSTLIGSTSSTYAIDTTRTRIAGNLTPSADNTYSLGDPALRWKDLWLSGGTANIAYDTSGTTTMTLGRDTTTTPRFKINANGLAVQLTAGNATGLNVDTTGKVGIGTMSPSAALEVKATGSTDGLRIHTQDQTQDLVKFYNDTYSPTTPAFQYFAANTGRFGMGSPTASDVGIYTNNSYNAPQLTVRGSNGYVGVQNNTPNYPLDVVGNINTNGTYYSNASFSDTIYNGSGASVANFGGSQGYWGLRTATNFSYNLDVYNGGSPLNAMTVLQNGRVGINTATPDTKLTVYQGAVSLSEPTLGTASGSFSLLGNGGLYGLYSGVAGSGNVWFQAMANDSAIAYGLELNPRGGNVGINSINPAATLQVGSNTVDDATAYKQIIAGAANTNTATTLLELTRPRTGGGYYGGGAGFNLKSNNIAITDNNNTQLDITLRNNEAGNLATILPVMSLQSAGNVGIGTIAPTGKLTIADASSAAQNLLQITNANDSLRYLTVSSTSTYLAGNVGIGTTAPGQKLEVVGRVLTSGSVAGVSIAPRGGTGSTFQWYSTAGTSLNLDMSGVGDGLAFNNNGSISVGTTYAATAGPANGAIIQGNVGIGTASPSQPLEVAGKIYSKGIDVSRGFTNVGDDAITLFNGTIQSQNSAITFSNTIATSGNLSFNNASPSIVSTGAGATISLGYSNQIVKLSALTLGTDDGYVVSQGQSFLTSGNATLFSATPSIQQNGTAGYTAFLVNPTETTIGTGIKRLLDLQQSGVSKMVVTNLGFVGIGSTSPNARLTVSASETTPTGNILAVTNANDSARYLTVSSTSTVIGSGKLEINNTSSAPSTNSPFTFENKTDQYNGGNTAMYMYAPSTPRLFFGDAAHPFYSLNFNYVNSFENFPAQISPNGNFVIEIGYGASLFLRHNPTQNSFIYPSTGGDDHTSFGYFHFKSNMNNTGTTGRAFVLDTSITRTGGTLFDVRNNGVSTLTVSATGGTTIATTTTSPSENLLQLQNSNNSAQYLTVSSTSTYARNKTFVDLNGTGTANAVCASANGGTNVELVDCTSTPSADYKEFYPTNDDVLPGDLVTFGTDSVTTTEGDTIPKLAATSIAYQSGILGIVVDPASANDFNSVGNNIKPEDRPMPMALNGRVKVNVTGENGHIRPGDPITSSSTDGFGMKATSPGRIVGLALADFNPTSASATGTVMVFVNPTWFNGAGAVSGATTPTALTVAADSIMDFQNSVITGLKAILSKSGTWSITDDGFLTAVHVEAKVVTTEQLNIKMGGDAQSAGVGTMQAGYTSTLITNPSLHENSMIVITFNGNPGSSWWVSEKHEGSFMLTLAAGAPDTVTFTWWAVGIDGSQVTDSGSSTPPADEPPLPTPPPTDSGSSTDPTDSGSSTSV